MLELLDVAIGFATVMLAVSLIIMSLTQAVSSALALRGVQLRKGLEQLIKQTAPSLAKEANRVSEAIVKHPLVSDGATILGGRWKWAAAVKKEELLPVLDAVLTELKLPALADADERQAIDAWFESFMARVSQWFVMNTRWITVGFAFVLAFTLHLDSMLILKQLTADTETRAKLQSMSASLLDQTPSTVTAVETYYTDALNALVASETTKLKPVAERIPIPTIRSRDAATTWIEANALPPTNGSPSVTPSLLKTFDDAVNKKLTESIDKSIDRAKTLESGLTSAGIALPPKGHTSKDWRDVSSSHFWGMVASVLFLSLGAPFWFNVLKNLTSLKSAVTTKNTTPPPPPGGSNAPPPPGSRGIPSVTSGSSPTLPPLPAKPADVKDDGSNSPKRPG